MYFFLFSAQSFLRRPLGAIGNEFGKGYEGGSGEVSFAMQHYFFAGFINVSRIINTRAVGFRGTQTMDYRQFLSVILSEKRLG